MKRLLLAISIFVISISFAGNARAATSTSYLSVTAFANVTCILQGAALDFGTYTGSTLQVTANVSVQCTNLTPYTIGYDQGQTFNGVRNMFGELGGLLPYSLICASELLVGPDMVVPAMDIECGDGVTFGQTSADAGDGLAQQWPVLGTLQGGQFVPSDNYSDNVLITLTY